MVGNKGNSKVAVRELPDPSTGAFLLVSHKDEGHRAYEYRDGDGVVSLSIPGGEEKVADERFLKDHVFRQDFQAGLIDLRRSDDPTPRARPQVAEEYESLSPSILSNVRQICYGKRITPQMEDMLNLPELMAGGLTKANASITKGTLANQFIPMVQCAMELETRYQNRKPVQARLKRALRAAQEQVGA